MGDAGSLVLVNGTPYTWQLTNIHSYQLAQWSFPRAIPPFSSTAVTVQRDDAPLRDRTQDGGEATYTLIGTSGTKPLMFQVQARADSGLPFRLQVLLQSVAAQDRPVGSLIKLGWIVQGQTNFVFAGTYNPTATGTGFVCNDMPSAWMQTSLPLLGSRMLRQICMPGTHDSGMAERNKTSVGVFDCNALTQRLGIADQLRLGARYFDLRPTWSDGGWHCGHYSIVQNRFLGANGQSFDKVVQQLNEFTAKNAELVILNHDINLEKPAASSNFTQDEWNSFLSHLSSSIRNLYTAPFGVDDLSSQTLKSFIGGGKAAVLCMFAPSDVSLQLSPQFSGKGFYRSGQLNQYDRYSNTNDVTAMVNDQLTKMRAQRTTPEGRFFVCSFTLTQNAVQAATCFMGTASSILELSAKANPKLFTMLWPNCTSTTYPNVLYIDGLDACIYAALAMSINSLLGAGKSSPSVTIEKQILSVDEEEAAHQNAAAAATGVPATQFESNQSMPPSLQHQISDQFNDASKRLEAGLAKKVDGLKKLRW